MKTRLPLFARILGWFFLNLLILGLGAAAFVGVQIKSGAEVLVSSLAGERLQSIARLLREEMAVRPRSDWDSIVARFSKAYRVRMYLFAHDTKQLAGDTVTLPGPVLQRLVDPRRAFREGPPRGFDPMLGPEPHPNPPLKEFGSRPGQNAEPRDARNLPPGVPRIRFVVRSDDPKTYWIGLPIPGGEPGRAPGLPVTLVLASNSLNAGGLIVDTKIWIWAAVAAAIFSVLFWLPLVRSITRSIAQMHHATAQIAEGKFDIRVNTARSDELGALGAGINQMAGRLDGFVKGQKRFMSDVAHELCSPIARMQMALGILEERADEKQAGYVQDVKEEVQHMSNLVNELLSFSRASLGSTTIRLQSVELRAIVDKAVKREGRDGVEIRNEVPVEARAVADPELVVRAVSNLLRNAIAYAGTAGPITISAQENNALTELSIADSGPGVPEAELPKLFDPFYRVDASRARETGGVGLGLAIVKTCIESCRGTVICRNRTPSGLEVILKLPRE